MVFGHSKALHVWAFFLCCVLLAVWTCAPTVRILFKQNVPCWRGRCPHLGFYAVWLVLNRLCCIPYVKVAECPCNHRFIPQRRCFVDGYLYQCQKQASLAIWRRINLQLILATRKLWPHSWKQLFMLVTKTLNRFFLWCWQILSH